MVTTSAVNTPAKPSMPGAQGSTQNKLNVPDPFTRRTTKLPRKRQPTQSSARYQVQKVPPDYQHLTPLKGESLLMLESCQLLQWTDIPKDKVEEMLIKKIQQCSYVFDFSDPMAELRAKEIKRAALNEVLDYIANNKGVITEPIYPEIVRMVGLFCSYDL